MGWGQDGAGSGRARLPPSLQIGVGWEGSPNAAVSPQLGPGHGVHGGPVWASVWAPGITDRIQGPGRRQCVGSPRAGVWGGVVSLCSVTDRKRGRVPPVLDRPSRLVEARIWTGVCQVCVHGASAQPRTGPCHVATGEPVQQVKSHAFQVTPPVTLGLGPPAPVTPQKTQPRGSFALFTLKSTDVSKLMSFIVSDVMTIQLVFFKL